jgi:hypothetical protein
MSEAARPEEGTYVSQLADLLVWGVRTGWNLLGRPINIRLTESDLGYTHPPSRGTPQAIYVNPKVLLEAGGFKVMQGLILHELGHHFAHFSDPRYKVVFGRCKADRMARMLNIIEDEHLERRLRGLDPEWGECLDALASYAFKGKPLELLIEKFAALHRESTLAEVIEALARGEIPGKVLKWEFGYELGAEIGRWVRGAELVDLVTAALTAAAPGGKLPAMVAEKMAEIRKEAASEWVRTGPLGVLDIMEDEPIFQRGRAGQESQARIHVSVALEATAEEQDDPSGYLDRIKRDIRPLLEDFPQLERFLKEVEASLGTKWFWQKQRSMLFMMRHRRDFTHAFLPAAEMSSKHFLHIFGKMAFHPGVILSRLVMRWQPRHLESREHPLKVAVSWLEMLDSPLTSDTLRFLVSLRLGLGNRGAGGREPVISALGAVPKNLRKLDMTGLEKVTREVAACLGECCLDPRRSRDSTVEEGEPGAPPTDGATLGEIQQGQMDELTSPLTPEEEKEQKGDLLKATEEAQKRIDEWLRTGIDPRNIGQKEKKGIRRGSQSRGVIRTEGSPSGKDKGQGLASLDWDFVNVADTLGFSIIEEIALPPPANDLQKRYAASVRGPVRAMRRFLLTLGQKDLETFGARQGRRLDPGLIFFSVCASTARGRWLTRTTWTRPSASPPCCWRRPGG